MKAFKLCLIGLGLSALLLNFGVGCGDDFEDEDTETGADGDSDSDADADPDLTNCADTDFSKFTCAAKIAAGAESAADCIADFGWNDPTLGYTNQAGYKDNYSLGYVGFYGYNDVTEGATQIPKPNYFASEPSAEIKSCDTNNDSALHLYASGFEGWGAGVGLDWGGPENPDCAVEGADKCLQLRIDDDHTPLAIAEASEACQTGGVVDEAKINCFKYGKNINAPKDLTGYSGIGFWTLATDKNQKDLLKVAFPIPLSMRFYSEYYGEEMGYNGVYCDEDAGKDPLKCYNDYTATVDLPITGDEDVNKWVYHQVLFGEIATSTIFGIQPAADVDPSYSNFPKDQSMGIKFQVDTWQAPMPDADFYIDDVILLK